MTRLLAVALAVAASAACFLPDPTNNERPPFPQTAFQALEEVQSATAFGNLTVGEGDRALYVGGNGGVATWDVSAGGMTFITAATSAATFPVFERGVLLVPLPDSGVEAWTTPDDGRTWQVIGTSALPATRVRLSGDDACLSRGDTVEVVDAAALLAGAATEADVRVEVTIPAGDAGDAVLVGDVLFVGSPDGALAFDLADPTEPDLFARVGDWFADRLLVHGDLLLVQSGYDTTVADISNPRDPVVLAHLLGGLDMAIRGDWLYALDREALYITDLSGEPKQVRQLPLVAECQSVAVTADAVFVTCAGQLRRLAPNEP